MSSSSLVDQQNPSWQRTVLLATDNCQSIIAEIADGKTNTLVYSAYGEQSAQQEVATRLGFNGQLREARIGWYILGNGYRAYNPRLMRFHSPDSWSPFGRGGLNPYTYCLGNPVNCTDPTGHWKVKSFRNIITLPNSRLEPLPAHITLKWRAEAIGRFQAEKAKQQSIPQPQKTNALSGLLGAAGYIAGQKSPTSWASGGGELHGSAHSSPTWNNPDIAPLVAWTVSGRSSDPGPSIPSFAPRQTVSTSRKSSIYSTHSTPASSGGQKVVKHLYNADTIAAAIPGGSKTAYPVGVGSPPPLQGPVRSGDVSGSSASAPLSTAPFGSTHSSTNRPTATVTGTSREEPPPPLPPRRSRLQQEQNNIRNPP